MKIKKKIKALHLASFLGNIGDYANHKGFYNKFSKNILAEFTQLEIRKFYKNRAELKFDDSFVRLINSHDLLVLGGGGFFDLNWDYSDTGTTMNFSEKFIDDIKIPVLVNAMGYHEFGEVKDNNVKKFKNFLEIITNNKNWFVSVRNDGSFDRLHNRYGNLAGKVLKVPDNGFFYAPGENSKFYLEKKDTIWIGLNITNDLFNDNFNNGIKVEIFNGLIAEFINRILKENFNYKIILFPHAHQDIVTMGKILGGIDDKYKRERMAVAPLFTGWESVDQVFDLYRTCSCIIGMRFHANVCSIGMNIPTLALAGHEQISSLYDEIGLSDRCVKINNKHFADELQSKLNNSLITTDQTKKDFSRICLGLNKQADVYYKKVSDWFL